MAVSPPSRRGFFSCLHSKCDDDARASSTAKGVTDRLHGLLIGFYGAAFDRLPFQGLQAQDAETLLTAMCTGGVCVGLMDPVSNIILNTISVLPRHFRPAQPSPPRRSKRLQPYTPRRPPPRKSKSRPEDDVWAYISRLSCHSLVRFLVRYFGCLTPHQAARYLFHADAHLALAVMLVDHDLYAASAILDPASQRTQAALKCAATTGRHPAPDDLVRLHTSPLPRHRLTPAAPFLHPGGRNLTLDDVKIVTELLRYQDSASLDLQVNLLPDRSGVVVYRRDLSSDQAKLIHHTSSSVSVAVDDDNNNGARFEVFTIKVERHGSHFASLLDQDTINASFSDKLDTAFLPGTFLKSCGDACEYTESLKMRLHATIHAFYLKVFTMLPSNVSHRLIRYILFAGHCYGPMEPVYNIIISSIWHSIAFPLPSPDRETQEAYDILDSLAMLRVEVRSLKGLIALVKANSGCTTQQAMEYLCFNGCHPSQEMRTGFVTAAEAAQHPQHAALGSFLSSHMLDNLRPLLSATNGTLSSESLDQVERILSMQLRETAVKSPESGLYKVVKDTLLIKRAEYNYLRLLIRSELATVLKQYAYEHPQEPKYEPSVICGVVETYYSDRDCYHVNFVAASESGTDNQLFFAELNFPCHQSKPNFCRRLCLTHTGRCFYGQTSSIKIMYPDSSDYFECDITCDGIKQAEMTLDADFVFDCSRDMQFAEAVLKYRDDRRPLSSVDPV